MSMRLAFLVANTPGPSVAVEVAAQVATKVAAERRV